MNWFNKRVLIIYSVFISFAGILVLRLFAICVVNNDYFKEKADNQNSITVNVAENRGNIYDRNMKAFTDIEPVSVCVAFSSNNYEKDAKLCKLLSENSGKTSKEMLDIITKHKAVSVELKNNYEREIALYDNVRITELSKRYLKDYPLSNTIGYILGGRGVSGIEKLYDGYLATGTKAGFTANVDAGRNLIKDFKIKASDFNNKNLSVVTTLDLDLSRICKNVLENEKFKGAVCLLDINTFDILALLSYPDFDPSKVGEYLNSKDNNLFNRAVNCYDMGSIFKIIVAGAALEKNAVSINELFYCSGKTDVSGKEFRCHKPDGHGYVNIKDAFANSCNCAFIEIGQRVGYENILKLAESFGIGKKIIFPKEFEQSSGDFPDAENYFLADLANISIGQGNLSGNVVHGAVMSAVIVNNGVIKNVNLIDHLVNNKGDSVESVRKDDEIRIISHDTADKLYDMMVSVVSDGTGKKANTKAVQCGGKTGTAQTGWYVNGENYQHGWFTGFFPAENPKYALCIFAENGKSGSDVAAPLFSKLASEIIKAE